MIIMYMYTIIQHPISTLQYSTPDYNKTHNNKDHQTTTYYIRLI